MRELVIVLLSAWLASPALAREPVLLHAAGSLRLALSDVAAAYEAAMMQPVKAVFGPSGLLRDSLAKGEKAEVFASANTAHPLALGGEGKAGPMVVFARNETCAFARSGLEVTTQTLLERMLDPAVKLGTSTPKADPSGDYVFSPKPRR